MSADTTFDPAGRLRELGVELPVIPKPVANYVPAVRAGNLVFLSGAIPKGPDGNWLRGQIGVEFTVEQGYEMAKGLALNLIAALQSEIGDLRKVRRLVRVEGMVRAPADFDKHSLVVNGASDFFVQVFGDRGRHARNSIGMGSLPMAVPLEIALIVEVED